MNHLEEVLDTTKEKIRSYLIATRTLIECGVVAIQTIDRLKEVLVKPDMSTDVEEKAYVEQ